MSRRPARLTYPQKFVEAIPKTASGKVLRRVLTEQERQRLTEASDERSDG